MAHRRYRLEILTELIADARKVRNVALAAQLVEQAAKEMALAYEKRSSFDDALLRDIATNLWGQSATSQPSSHPSSVIFQIWDVLRRTKENFNEVDKLQ